MTPFPPLRVGFHRGGLVRCPLCCGVNGFALGVVIRVGYRPTGSSVMEVNPLLGAPPRAQNPNEVWINKCIAKSPHNGVTPP